MKKLFIAFLFISALVFSSCNDNNRTLQANSMADELCKTMAIMNLDDTATFQPVYEGIVKILENENYKEVTVVELDSAMKEKCPDGLKMYKTLVKIGEEKNLNKKDSVQ